MEQNAIDDRLSGWLQRPAGEPACRDSVLPENQLAETASCRRTSLPRQRPAGEPACRDSVLPENQLAETRLRVEDTRILCVFGFLPLRKLPERGQSMRSSRQKRLHYEFFLGFIS